MRATATQIAQRTLANLACDASTNIDLTGADVSQASVGHAVSPTFLNHKPVCTLNPIRPYQVYPCGCKNPQPKP